MSRALSFAGRTSRVEYVRVPSLANQRSFTWATWAKPNARRTIHPIIERGIGSDVRKSFSFDDSAASARRSVFVRVRARDASALAVSEPDAWTNGEWAHWSVTYDDAGDRVPRIFRNGVEVAYRLRVATSGPVADDADATTALAATPINAFYHYTGLLDDVRVYGRVMSAAELAALARVPAPPTTSIVTAMTTAATMPSTVASTAAPTTTQPTASSTSSPAVPTTLAPTTTGPTTAAPRILFTDVEGGPVSGGPGNRGVPISIFGKGFGATRGASKVTIGGVEAAGYMSWGAGNANNPGLDMITVQPGPNVT